ncbi:zinc finger BED domain-containing protein 1-like [Rhizophagus clarus]|uniref:Zinc finger BED domain-containing protein 1-like n=1 Tax=Rhizophagus clarus TaxID=94130 RepID=A0A8H3M8E7_9GLOM|nr:zinc finger BED domain-containing protein 1-like [Rhizophagus clarus]
MCKKEISHLSKKQCNITQTEEQEEQEPQWTSNTGKTSFVWKFFQAKTNGRAYCRYIDNDNGDECRYSCVYKTQTSTMIYHINNVHKEYKKKSEQLKVDEQFKKVTPYKEPLQQKLRNGVADWIVTDGLPFNTVRGKGFKRMINNINPAFIPPCYATLKRDIGCGYKTAVELMKSYIEETCIYASITTDLWTSRAKTGYIEKILYPHTGTHIREIIQEKLKVLGLEKKVNVAVTDNGSNMVKAINEWDGVSRVACSAHTLQLCVLKGLKQIKPYLQRYAKLNQFFESPKQTERLEDAQREIIRQEERIANETGLSPSVENNENADENNQHEKNKPLKILRTITEVPTRWGSKLASWKRLKELKKPINRLCVTLGLETDYEARKDYQRLTALMLSDFEWKLLDKLIETLTPIESATQFLGGQKYCMLSLIFSSIQILKFDYTPDPNISVNSDENNEENNEENLHLEIEDEFAEYLPLSSDDDINSIINSIKKGIYDALFEYWNIPPNSTLLAGLLDPRSKTMYGWSYELQELAKLLLNAEYEEYKDNDIPIQIYPLSQSQSQSFSSRIFGPQIHLSTDNELTQYLDNFRTPQASPDTDIFKWWIDNREKFPTLFKVARKYLGILATSVPSERLFSDAGNQITSERNRLKAETVNEILFLKRNMEYINPFK